MAGKYMIELVMPTRAGSALALLVNNATAPHRGFEAIASLFNGIASGVYPALARVSVDDSVGVKATATITLTYANITAADYYSIVINGRVYTLTCVTSGTPAANDGTFKKITDATTTATNLKNAINSLVGLNDATNGVAATSSSGVVTLTMNRAGGTGINQTSPGGVNLVVKQAAAGAALVQMAGGKDAGQKQSLTATLGGALTAADTVTIGSVVLTARVSPSNESEFAATVSAAADGAALAACINAHSKLKGLLSASGTSTVTVTALEGGRWGALVSISKSAAQITLSATSFAPSTTETWVSTGVEIATGAVAS